MSWGHFPLLLYKNLSQVSASFCLLRQISNVVLTKGNLTGSLVISINEISFALLVILRGVW